MADSVQAGLPVVRRLPEPGHPAERVKQVVLQDNVSTGYNFL
jgi:hypothetical protein